MLKKNTCWLRVEKMKLKAAHKLVTSHLRLVAKLQWDIVVMDYLLMN